MLLRRPPTHVDAFLSPIRRSSPLELRSELTQNRASWYKYSCFWRVDRRSTALCSSPRSLQRKQAASLYNMRAPSPMLLGCSENTVGVMEGRFFGKLSRYFPIVCRLNKPPQNVAAREITKQPGFAGTSVISGPPFSVKNSRTCRGRTAPPSPLLFPRPVITVMLQGARTLDFSSDKINLMIVCATAAEQP